VREQCFWSHPSQKKDTPYFVLAKFSCHGTCLKFFSAATFSRHRLAAARFPLPCVLPRHAFCAFSLPRPCLDTVLLLSVFPSPCNLPRPGFGQFYLPWCPHSVTPACFESFSYSIVLGAYPSRLAFSCLLGCRRVCAQSYACLLSLC
jgi:hypothetical protein